MTSEAVRPSINESARPPIDETISRVNPLVAKIAAELKGLTNGAGIKPSDLTLYRLLLKKRVAALSERLTSVNFEADIFEGNILGEVSQGETSEAPRTWPVLVVAGSLGGQVPPFPRGDLSQSTLESLAGSMGDHSFASFAVLTDAVQPKRYAAGSFVTVPVKTVNAGKINETSHQFKLP